MGHVGARPAESPVLQRYAQKAAGQLAADIEQWSHFAAAVSKVLLPA